MGEMGTREWCWKNRRRYHASHDYLGDSAARAWTILGPKQEGRAAKEPGSKFDHTKPPVVWDVLEVMGGAQIGGSSGGYQ